MTVGKLSLVCWVVFGVMCLAFLPLGAGIFALHALPGAIRVVLAVVVVGGLWWGPFGYGMYLSQVVIRKGDPRLIKRGIRGKATVLAAKATNTVIQSGEFAWEAPRVWKYRLGVEMPGKSPYQTDCSICVPGLPAGTTVDVAVSPLNRKRVVIDLGQTRKGVDPVRIAALRSSGGQHNSGLRRLVAPEMQTTGPGQTAASHRRSANSERLHDLEKLADLHKQGVLTDEEFAAEKARILKE